MSTHVETSWHREPDPSNPAPPLSITYSRLVDHPVITGTDIPVTDEVYRAYGYVKRRRTVTDWEPVPDGD